MFKYVIYLARGGEDLAPFAKRLDSWTDDNDFVIIRVLLVPLELGHELISKSNKGAGYYVETSESLQLSDLLPQFTYVGYGAIPEDPIQA